MKIHTCAMVMLVLLLTAMRMHASESVAGHRFERVSVFIAYQEFFYESADQSYNELNVAITTDAYEKMKTNPAQFFAIPKEHICEGKKSPYADDIYCLTVTDKKTFEQLKKAGAIDLQQWQNFIACDVIMPVHGGWYESYAGIIDSDFARGRIVQKIIDRDMATYENANKIYDLNRTIQKNAPKFSNECCNVSQKLTDIVTHYIYADTLQKLFKNLLKKEAYLSIEIARDTQRTLWAHFCQQEEGKRYMEAWVKGLNAQQRMQLQDAINYDGESAATNAVWQAIKGAIEPALKGIFVHQRIDNNADRDHNRHDRDGIENTLCKKALLKKVGVTALIGVCAAAGGYWWYTRNAAASDNNTAPIQ